MTDLQNKQIQEAVKQQRGKLLSFINKRVRNEEEAEDILQDVFYQLVETYRLMKPIEQMSAWLFRVARNKITDRYRKKKTERLEDTVPPKSEEDEPLLLADLLSNGNGTAEDMMMNEMVMESIAEALDELPAEQREVFVWHELEDLSFSEIAAMTGESVNTLLSRKRYAVLFLRERLRHLYNDLFNE